MLAQLFYSTLLNPLTTMPMKHLLAFPLMMLFGLLPPAAAQLRNHPNNAFTFGEKITYRIKYSLYFNFNVGEITFEINNKAESIGGKDCFHAVAKGRTYGFYDPVFKVRDQYESYIEMQSILPFLFIRNVSEGDFKFNEYVVFNQQKNMAKSTKRTQKIPPFTQDMLSSIYYARTIDYTRAAYGQEYYIDAFIDDSAYHVGFKFMGRQTISTNAGKFRCIKLQPILIVDRVFKSEDQMNLWVTDDENKIPVRIESGISVGTVKADLVSYEGLKNPVKSKL